MTDQIPDTPPEDEEGRAIWTIRRVAKAMTGKTMSEEEGRSLFELAKQRLEAAQKASQPPATDPASNG